ncbi:MAG: DNA polymerase III subunit epsilon [Vibrio hibernica]
MNTSTNSSHDRIIVLDTETTGMNREGGPVYMGHRIIEIGAVEIIDRKLTGKHFHCYIKPDRLNDPEAIGVHGITDEFLVGKPEYKAIHQEFIDFIRGAELVAHNAPFDTGFMDYEFKLNGSNEKTADLCKVTDTLAMAKKIFPGKRNNLDILCDRYGIDNSHRTLHGALLDAEILADVYLLMTGGQTSMQFNAGQSKDGGVGETIRRVSSDRVLKVLKASDEEQQQHEERLDLVAKKGACLWRETVIKD